MKTRINIFLTRDEKIQLENIKFKYRISLSTIVEIIVAYYSVVYPIEQILLGQRLVKSGTKTSIKVEEQNKKTYSYYENALHLFLNKQMVKDLFKEIYKDQATSMYGKVQNMIYNKFAQTEDKYYNYNMFIRYQAAYERKMRGA